MSVNMAAHARNAAGWVWKTTLKRFEDLFIENRRFSAGSGRLSLTTCTQNLHSSKSKGYIEGYIGEYLGVTNLSGY